MRTVMNILIVGVIAVLAALFFSQQRAVEDHADAEQRVRDGLARLYERTAYHGALLRSAQTVVDPDALPYPLEVLPEWFGDAMPINLFAKGHPWIDVAPRGDDATHPPDPVLLRPGQAGFWYNPNNGTFRVRVKPEAGDAQTLAFYNRLNETQLDALPRDASLDRTPLAYHPPNMPGLARAAQAPEAASRAVAPGAALFEPAPGVSPATATAPATGTSWMPAELQPKAQPEPAPIESTEPARPTLVKRSPR